MKSRTIDHLAFRVFDRNKAVKFFKDVLGYKEQDEFTIYFNDEKTETALCTALEPGDKVKEAPFNYFLPFGEQTQEYVSKPEIFVSEGSPGSIVHGWCVKQGAGLHHIAILCPEESTVEEEMKRWLDLGWTQGFTSDVIKCDDLHQVFTKPDSVLGVVFEIIKRKERGFCKDSVKILMEKSKGD